ncbi:hypothetical protein VXF94_15595 [Bacillus amyloliquefaciens]|nr:hypothetical protein [Bacillus amyloliquefaciens]MCZ4246364.1 hypothetical protein [Bacillus amyloliquefaciens]
MTDFERKSYQIFVNMRLHGKNPTLPELKKVREKRTRNTRTTKKA